MLLQPCKQQDSPMTFAPGQSGNPSGRKRGSVNQSTRLRKAIEGRLPGIVDQLIAAAEAGDVAAASLLFSRALPALKPVDAPAPLALGADTADLGAVSAAVLAGLGQGALSIDQAAGLASALGALVRVREATELEARITRLEESANGKS